MVETFKTLRGFNRVEKSAWFQLQNDDARPTRSNAVVLDGSEVRRREVIVQPRANLELRKNFYTIRAAGEWNGIPDAVKEATTVNGFKNAYDVWKKRQQNLRMES